MRSASLVIVMGEDQKDEAALAAAGYTGPREAVLFCVLLAVVGGLVGSVVISILWNAMVPGTSEAVSTAVGAGFGALGLVLVGLIKIRQGNLEAREQVDDKEWRRHLRRELGK
jgi:hypothetical protein